MPLVIACLLALPATLTCAHAAEDTNIAFAATITAEPEVVPGSLLRLIDGNVRTALTFEVGTEGGGAVTFAFDTPRVVSGVRFYQSSGIYYVTSHAIEADTDGNGQFDLLVAEGAETPVQTWVEHHWEPVVLRGLRFRAVEGVSEGRRAHPVMAEFQILGRPEADDMEKAAAAGVPIPFLTRVRELRRDTPLVVNGHAPALLAPEGDEFEAALEALLAGLAERGVMAEAVSDIAAADPANRTVICLGNMLTNPLIERLYWNRYTFADALTPGPGRYLLHTVFDPYPYNGGNDVIIIGCGDATGAEAGVARFLEVIGEGGMPYVVEAGPEPALNEAAEARIEARTPNPTFTEFTTHANQYLRTGSQAHARKAIETLEIMAALYGPGGERVDPAAAKRVRLPWNEETTSWEINCAWDAFEHNPLLTDDQRLRFSNAFLRFTRDLVGYVSGYGRLGTDDLVTWNHTTFPMLGIHFGARYFHRYYALADMPEMLEKARACFLAQARSWKPEEDADSYLPLTPEHTHVYCLAEGHMGHFESGLFAQYADYVVAVCDNRGWGSGFGDSGLSSTPRIPMRVLPLALWWTGDPGYAWLLDHYSDGAFRSPYDRGVQPVRPDRFTGVNVFMLDAQLYQFTQTRPFYNEPLEPSDVLLEQAFDKVTFRDNWDMEGQYLILDGFSRGKHLHYDGNSIIEFVEGGERWLLDHDYLIRNTTEHTMLSVLRDGRCDRLIPSMAGLEAWADLPRFGYTHTWKRDYNGCDWDRRLLWRRGEWFIVADTISPREPGRYDLELTWKTIDSGGEQYIVNGADFLAERGRGDMRTVDCVVVDDAEASEGRALLMDRSTSRVAFGVNLPAGEYALEVIAYGVDTSSDSLWISVNLGPKQAFHIPIARYGRSAADHAHTTATPRVTLEGEGPHSLVVTLRENPPVRVDRFIFHDANGARHVFEAEDLPPAPDADLALTRSFHIKPTTPVTAWVTNHERQGIATPVSILHQRTGGDLEAGETVRFASLMYTSLPASRRDLRPVRLADNLLAVQGTDPALVLLGAVDGHGVAADLAAGILAPDSLHVSGLRRLAVGGLEMSATAPVDLALDLDANRLTVEAPEAVELTFTLGEARRALSLEPGRTEAQLDDLPGMAQVAAAILALVEGAEAETAAAQDAPAEQEQTAPLWSALEPGAEVHRIRTADLGDGAGERVFVCQGPNLVCLSPEGEALWEFRTDGRVTAVAFGDVRPAPGQEVVVGSADTHVYILSAAGELLDRRQMRGVPWARSFGDQAYSVYDVGVWDITGDGRPEILVTLRNFDLQAHTADWQLLWKHDHALHGSMQMTFEDTDGDGAPDTVFVGDKYGSSIGVGLHGRAVHRTYTSIGDVFYALADLTGDGKTEVVTGSSTGDMVAAPLGRNVRPMWRFDNYGYPVNRLRAADLTGDGSAEIIMASGTGYLYVLDAQGQVLWQDRAGLCVNDVVVFSAGEQVLVAYADEGGLVRITDGGGDVLRELQLPAAPRVLAPLTADGEALLLIGLADGRVEAHAVSPPR